MQFIFIYFYFIFALVSVSEIFPSFPTQFLLWTVTLLWFSLMYPRNWRQKGQGRWREPFAQENLLQIFLTFWSDNIDSATYLLTILPEKFPRGPFFFFLKLVRVFFAFRSDSIWSLENIITFQQALRSHSWLLNLPRLCHSVGIM